MGVVRTGDIDQVNVLALDQPPPVGFHRLVAPVARERLEAVLVACRDGLEYRLDGEIEVARRLKKRVRMRTAHEAVADESDIELLLRHGLLPYTDTATGAFQPCVLRTSIISLSTSSHVCGFIIVSLENIQPSQQMCSTARSGIPSSSRSQKPA